MKQTATLFALALCIAPLANMAAQEFLVQIAAYSEKMPDAFFKEKGVEKVACTSQMGMHKYFASACLTREDAEKVQTEMIGKGFPYAIIIDLEEERALNETHCPYLRNGKAYAQLLKGTEKERNIFFDFGKHSLDAESKEALDWVCARLKENRDFKLKIEGYTDGVGSATANMELAGNRARAARNYLIGKGVRADRMFIKIFGEAESLAPNSEEISEGVKQDLPENRKWNRRVKLLIFEGEDEADNTAGGK
ncbi:MAG: OmpA family protein [Saprospiraceae bacterium]|nr:OmpA family protein [Saprospiraceae bacterium]